MIHFEIKDIKRDSTFSYVYIKKKEERCDSCFIIIGMCIVYNVTGKVNN